MVLRFHHVSGVRVLLVLFCLCGFWSSVGARGDQEPVPAEAEPISGPVWKDAATGEILFTVDDVLAFNWDDQVFVLELDAALDFLAWMVPHKYQSRELLVEDEEGLIYRGRWVNLISSIAFWGPVYESMGMSRLFCINDGYPGFSGGASADADARYAPRLHAALERKGVLCQVDPNQAFVAFGIDGVRTDWRNCGEDLRVRVEFFPDTFRVGQEARAHVFFSTYPYESVADIDCLRIEIKFVADGGQYRSDVQIDDIPVEVISEGVYACRFRPWTPCPGSKAAIEEAGAAYISLSLLLCRTVESGVEIVRRLDFPEQPVAVHLPFRVVDAGGE